MGDMKITFIAKMRTKLRKYIQKWWYFKAAKIYGNHIYPTVRLSSTTSLDKTNPGGVFIDEYTYLAGEVIILAHDMCRELRTTTRIGKRCFIGARAIILPGVIIGDEVIIGSGAIVTKNIPSNCIVAGNPAKIIKLGIRTKNYGKLLKDETK